MWDDHQIISSIYLLKKRFFRFLRLFKTDLKSTEAVIYYSWVLFIYVFLQIDDSTFQKVNLMSVLLF